MSKGEQTRQRILERAAPLLNRQGYQSAPVSEIMRVTGLQKGGLYNHFESKEELALAAFDLLMERVNHKVLEVHRSHSSPIVPSGHSAPVSGSTITPWLLHASRPTATISLALGWLGTTSMN